MNFVNYKHLGEVDLIIDGNSFMFRNFDYSNDKSKMLYTSDGKPTVSVFRTIKQILGFYSLFDVRSITVALDNLKTNRSTVRHLIYPAYKMNRPEKPPEIIPQFDYFKEILDAIDIHYIESPPLYEGDDVIGTVAYNWAINKKKNIIISADQDMLQLVSNYTAFLCINMSKKYEDPNYMYTLKTLNPELHIKSIDNEFGLSPLQFADVKALTGDTSDNIPGVGGIGKKTAIPLIQKYKSLEGVYDAVEDIVQNGADIKNTLFTPKMIEKLVADEQVAFISKELAMIHRDIKVNFLRKRGNFKSEKALKVFQKYEFKELIRTLFN